MKGKFEDKLAQLAFGELSPEEAARLEAEVRQEPEAMRALSQYREMRDGLKGLSHVPEDQFSKERLRDAILAQGLRPRPLRPVSSRSWLWMPAFACILGFGLVAAKNSFLHPNMPPQIVGFSADSIPPVGGQNAQDPFRAISPTKTSDAHKAPALRVASNDKIDNSARNQDPDEVDHKISAHVYTETDEGYDVNLGDPSVHAASAPTMVAAPSSTPNGASSTGPIVLIDQEKDSQTGANKATEVGSSSNVLVGG